MSDFGVSLFSGVNGTPIKAQQDKINLIIN